MAIVLDLVLPDGSGVDVCSEIRGWSALPIVVLSALADYELVGFRRRCGNWSSRAPGKRAWQRETFTEERRYAAPEVANRLVEVLS